LHVISIYANGFFTLNRRQALLNHFNGVTQLKGFQEAMMEMQTSLSARGGQLHTLRTVGC